MSSMFKKKGGPAFKPKIPSGRPRPAPASSQPPKSIPPPLPTPISQVSAQDQSQVPSQDVTEPSISQISSTGESDPATSQPSQSQPQSQSQPRQKSPTPPPTVEASQDNTTSRQPASKSQSQSKGSETAVHGASKQAAVVEAEAPIVTAPPQAEADVPQSTPTILPGSAPSATIDHVAATPAAAIIQPQITGNAPTDETREESTEPVSSATPSVAPIDSSEIPTPSASEPQAATRPIRKTRAKKQPAQSSPDDTPAEEETARPKKRQRKTPTAAATQEGQDGEPKQQPKKRRSARQAGAAAANRRRARSITPEDSENQVVDLQSLKMSDLTRDLHIGKKFSRHDELRERERLARLKTKLGSDGERDSSATPEASEQGAKRDSPAVASGASTPSTPVPTSGPQFRIVDGQIIVDQTSLVMDRHARAVATQGNMETVEENDFTRLITSNSFMNTSKLKGPNIWSDQETELFYRGLRMFGTDFEMISKMFPGKQRRHVKLKYNREERHCPRRIDAAVVGEKTIKLDIDEYKAFTGSEFESVESIEAEQRKRQEDFEAEQKRIVDEQTEIMRKKKEELFKDDEDGDAKKKKKKKKQTIVYGLNGEPIAQED